MCEVELAEEQKRQGMYVSRGHLACVWGYAVRARARAHACVSRRATESKPPGRKLRTIKPNGSPCAHTALSPQHLLAAVTLRHLPDVSCLTELHYEETGTKTSNKGSVVIKGPEIICQQRTKSAPPPKPPLSLMDWTDCRGRAPGTLVTVPGPGPEVELHVALSGGRGSVQDRGGRHPSPEFSSFLGYGEPGFSSSAPLPLCVGDSLSWGLPCALWVFTSIPGLYPLDAGSTASVVTTNNVSRYRQCPVEGKIRTTGVNFI